MKLGRFFALFTLLIIVGWNSVIAQSVTFSDLSLKLNVPDDSGKKMLQFHYKMKISGCQGHEVKVYMYVDIPKGTGHKFADGKQMVSISKPLTCTEETTSFNRWNGIYNDKLNPLPGKNTYYTRLFVMDVNTGKWIGNSDFLSFDNTGSEASVASSKASSAKAVLNSCYVVHKDKDMEGKKEGIRFHLNLSVNGRKDQKVWCIIEMAYYEGDESYYFSHSKGDYEYNGHLAAYKQIVPTYENSKWEDLQLFIPYREFRNSVGDIEQWKKGITFCVKVVDSDGKVLMQKWQDSERIGYYQHIGSYENCYGWNCSHTSVCNQCKGRGVNYVQYVGLMQCPLCKGTGKNTCNVCGGTGKTRKITLYTYDIKVNSSKSNPEKKVPSQTPSKEWSGTGFALKDGYVVTNYHVVDGAKSITIKGVRGNSNSSYKAIVVATDKHNDLALVRINDSRFTGFGTIPYSIKTTLSEVGEDVFVLGYPLTNTMGDEIKLTTGVISSRTGYQGDVSCYQISAPIQPGNSGGPLFDSNGNIIGVVNAKHTQAENAGYAIKTSYMKSLVESSVSTSIFPTNNIISGQPLTNKVKSIKDFVFMIRCTN